MFKCAKWKEDISTPHPWHNRKWGISDLDRKAFHQFPQRLQVIWISDSRPWKNDSTIGVALDCDAATAQLVTGHRAVWCVNIATIATIATILVEVSKLAKSKGPLCFWQTVDLCLKQPWQKQSKSNRIDANKPEFSALNWKPRFWEWCRTHGEAVWKVNMTRVYCESYSSSASVLCDRTWRFKETSRSK